MQAIALDMPRASGIYGIYCSADDKWYVGQSNDVRTRSRDHRSELISGRHCNKHLQSAWTKYGEYSFSFWVLELCAEAARDERERHWIEFCSSLDKQYGYNKESGGCGNKRLSPETRAAIAASKRDRSASEETRQKMSAAHRGRRHTEESKRKMSEKLRSLPRSPAQIATAKSLALASVGRTWTDNQRSLCTEARRRENLSPATLQKLSEARRGRPHPMSVVATEALRERNRTRVYTQEIKEKMRTASLGRVVSEVTKQKISVGLRAAYARGTRTSNKKK